MDKAAGSENEPEQRATEKRTRTEHHMGRRTVVRRRGLIAPPPPETTWVCRFLDTRGKKGLKASERSEEKFLERESSYNWICKSWIVSEKWMNEIVP